MNTRCERCHAEIAAEWRASLHRQSHTSQTYRDQLVREPRAFCDGCHAPEADPPGPVAEGPSQMGVGCVTCHVAGDRLLAGPGPGRTAETTKTDGTVKTASTEGTADATEIAGGERAHEDLTRTADLAGPWGCASCHEFAFPGARRGPAPLLMQSTVSEHARSAHRDKPCASCHMPERRGPAGAHRDHTFSASRDPDLVRSAVEIREELREGGSLRLALTPGRVGHAFPTGDMLRRLSLTIEATSAAGEVVAREQRYLARHFGLVRTPTTPLRRVLLADDRVGASGDPVIIDYTPPAAAEGGRLRYLLRYERVANPEGDEHGSPVFEGFLVLADRTLPVPLPAPSR
ncbi:MAG: multiheme c-type cytochrome [Polyangiaceae bacterium]